MTHYFSAIASLLLIGVIANWPTQVHAAAGPHDASTSDDRRISYTCQLQGTDQATRLIKPLQRSDFVFRDAEGNNIEGKALLGASAFADLGGDGTLDKIAFIAGLQVPRILTPVFVYPDDYPSKNLNPYGYSRDFGFAATGKEITEIAVDDLNGDGVDDLIFADYGEHDISKLQGGRITAALSVGKGGKYIYGDIGAPPNIYHRVVTLDIDNDGDKDIVAVGPPKFVTGSKKETWIVVLLNDGTGNFKYSSVLSKNGHDTWGVGAGDIDGDGYADLITSDDYNVAYNRSGPHLRIYWGNSDKAPTVIKIKAGARSNAVSYGDIDGDGNKDIIYSDTAEKLDDNFVTVVRMKGRKVLGQRLFHHSQQGGGSFSINDLNACGAEIYTYVDTAPEFVHILPTE